MVHIGTYNTITVYYFVCTSFNDDINKIYWCQQEQLLYDGIQINTQYNKPLPVTFDMKYTNLLTDSIPHQVLPQYENIDMITNTLPTTELEMKTYAAYGVIK